jgi:hypothetical protein
MVMIDVREEGVRVPNTAIGVDALARIRAEAALIRAHDAEYRKLLARGDRVRAVCALVKRHAVEYGGLVRAIRDEVRASKLVEADAA